MTNNDTIARNSLRWQPVAQVLKLRYNWYIAVHVAITRRKAW
jgi:hypothetical protein